MSHHRILICDELDPSALDVFRERGFEPELALGLGEEDLCKRVGDAHAIVVRSGTRITRAVIDAARELQVVGRAGVGVDNVDLGAATDRGVVVMNTPTGNTTTTGELALALLFALARHVPRGDRRTRSGAWGKKGLVGTELTGKTLGVIGLGRIGRVVAERALGLRMEVLGHDPYLMDTGRKSPVEGVDLVELEKLLEHADFVTLHVPLGDGTRGMISRERIAAMKPGARLINAARGGLVDEAAVAEALDSGQLAGAAFDVLAEEPPSPEHPLLGRDDVIITPHLGASSREAQVRVGTDIAAQISDFLVQGVAHNAVNAPAVSAAERRTLAPYLQLVERMGSFLAQRLDEPVRKIELTLEGDIAQTGAEHLVRAVQVGVLRRGHAGGVNFVNAPILAKERGLRVLEQRGEDSGYYQNMIKVRASSKGGGESHLVAGTVFGSRPRLVRVDDMHVDFAPEGTLLVTRHRDQPGVLGQVGTVLGRHGINIRRVELGPPTTGNDDLASAFLALYDPLDEGVLGELRDLDPIVEVRPLHLA